MFDDLIGAVIPGGALVGVGLMIGAMFGERLRPLAKRAIKEGLTVFEKVQELSAEALERSQDLVAEARYEQQQSDALELKARRPAIPRVAATKVVASNGAAHTRPRRTKGTSVTEA